MSIKIRPRTVRTLATVLQAYTPKQKKTVTHKPRTAINMSRPKN